MPIKLTCQHCGKEFWLIPSRIKWGRGKHCSPECQYAAIKLRPKKAQVKRICKGCGNIFSIYISQLKSRKGGGKYCSRKCRDKNRVKENHPQYLNGTSSERRGPNWQSQKRKARIRDNFTCKKCGRKLAKDVHHKIPFRKFGILNYKKANRLSNLITLCRVCHRKEDIKTQRRERS